MSTFHQLDTSNSIPPEGVEGISENDMSSNERRGESNGLHGLIRKGSSGSVEDGFERAKDDSGPRGLDELGPEMEPSAFGGSVNKEAVGNTGMGTTQLMNSSLSEQTRELSLYSQSQEASSSSPTVPKSAQVTEGPEAPPPLPPKDKAYLDPTPRTPRIPSPSGQYSDTLPYFQGQEKSTHSDAGLPNAPSRPSSEADFEEQPPKSQSKGADAESGLEIQNIMDQFDQGDGGPGIDEAMSTRLELTGPTLGSPIQYPPRHSSLEPLRTGATNALQMSSDIPPLKLPSADAVTSLQSGASASSHHDPLALRRTSRTQSFDVQSPNNEAPISPNAQSSLHKAPPPEPDPEPELPFDFHRFLEQLRHRTADPVAKFLRSFLSEFGKKQWMVHEQVKIIGDFLAFITNKMAQCEVWRGVSDAEFDNAREGMEKLVMNRLYAQTFSPAIQPLAPSPTKKGKRKDIDKPAGPGRRGQHQEDIERDEILAQKVRIYGWVREEHLDIAPVGESGRRFLVLAQQGPLYNIRD